MMSSILLLEFFVKPPNNLPDLYPVVNSVVSCLHFVFFFVYFNYREYVLSRKAAPKQKVQ